MWSHTDDERFRLGATDAGPFPEAALKISPGEIDRRLYHAREIRAREVARLLRRLGQAVGRLFQRRRPATVESPLALAAENVKTPLTSIRASAEILRDNPNLSPEQRNRFLDVVLSENERIVRLVGEIIFAAEHEVERRRPAVDADALETRPPHSALLEARAAKENRCRP